MDDRDVGDSTVKVVSLPSAIGVDLGTTKTCLTLSRRDRDGGLALQVPVVREPGVPPGTVAVPSVVAVRDGRPIVGHAAKRLIRTPGFQPGLGSFPEAKNLIGLKYTYRCREPGFTTPTEIAAHVLRGAMQLTGARPEMFGGPVVIGVPASFHGAQRRATLEAARAAFGDNRQISLLDEPYAAMLDLLHGMPKDRQKLLENGKRWLVFDFGGGTCDVALFQMGSVQGAPAPRLLATSRYHRLGGGDIDRAIVHDHLLPMLLKQHELRRTDMAYGEKRKVIEPQLIPLAEQLKIALCRRLEQMEDATEEEKAAVEVMLSGEHPIRRASGQELWFSDLSLDEPTFRRILAPFLDPEVPPEGSDEYVQRESIFSPIHSALADAELEFEYIDAVLMAGSSSRIPHVFDALYEAMSAAEWFGPHNQPQHQAAVARGAALQALALAETGQPLIAPVSTDAIRLRTRPRPVLMVSSGQALPAEASCPLLIYAPESRPDRPLDIAIEIEVGSGRVVGQAVWQLEAPVEEGEPLEVRWSVDENQCISLQLDRVRSQEGDEALRLRFDAPLTHIDQGQRARCRLLENEESLRCDLVPRSEFGRLYDAMAQDCLILGENERALHFLSCAIQEQGALPHLLNRRGNALDALGEIEQAEAVYREAAPYHSGAAFNLALSLKKRGARQEALQAIDEAIALQDAPAFRVLRGEILQGIGRAQEARLEFQEAASRSPRLDVHNSWSLGWLRAGAKHLGQEERVGAIDRAMRQLRKESKDSELSGALLPCSVASDGAQRSAA